MSAYSKRVFNVSIVHLHLSASLTQAVAAYQRGEFWAKISDLMVFKCKREVKCRGAYIVQHAAAGNAILFAC